MFEAKKTKSRKFVCHSLPDSYTEWYLSEIIYLTLYLSVLFLKGKEWIEFEDRKPFRHMRPNSNYLSNTFLITSVSRIKLCLATEKQLSKRFCIVMVCEQVEKQTLMKYITRNI